jgi:hypothetical protein
VLTRDSVPYAGSAEAVTFEAGSHMRLLEASAFRQFPSLKSICIPASVEVLGTNSLVGAELEIVMFERGSTLRKFEYKACGGCDWPVQPVTTRVEPAFDSGRCGANDLEQPSRMT